MRILQVNTFHERLGGAEVYLHDLIDGLRARGHAVALFAGAAGKSIDEPELRVVRRPEFEADRLAGDDELEAELERFARRFGPELVHVHNVRNFPASIVARIGALGVPVLQTVHDCAQLCPNSWCVWPDGTVCEGGAGQKCLEHGCEANYPFDGRMIAATRLRDELTRGCFDRFLAPSPFLAERLRAHGYAPVEHLPFWVDPAVAPPTEEPREPVALFVGRLVPEKGVEFLLRAWPAVVAAVPRARLEIVGGGALEPALRQLASELGLGSAIVFHGRVPRERVADFMRAASVQVLPSIWCENAPITCVEGLALGLPMVASAIGGLPALVVEDETGVLARPRDPADLARALVAVLGDAGRRARLARGCLALAGRLTRARHFERIEAIAHEMAQAPRAARGTAVAEPELLACLDAFYQQVGDLERWALGMKSHIAFLDGQLGPEKPLSSLRDHVRRLVRWRLGKR